LAAAATAMAATPLLALLGFESSFLIGLLTALAAAHLGAESVWRARGAASPADGDLAEARPISSVARLFSRAFVRVALLCGLPLLILSANALRVKNCDIATGVAWFALLPLVTAATGTTAGVFAGLTARRRIGGTLLAIAIVIVSLFWGVVRFYRAPPVFGYDPFGGWFPGSLYDEELAIGATLLAARAIHLLGALSALALAAALLDGRALRLGLRVRSGRAFLLFAILATIWAGARHAWRAEIAPDAGTIAKGLGATRETNHLILHYTPSGPWSKEIDLVAEDAEFRWSQLARTFGVAPDGKITAFLFDNPQEKRRWMGASHTQVAKPWRREIYLQYESWPHPAEKHELAHVFAGEFGDPIFHVARHGLVFNVGLIEGAAVAADDRPERVSLDQQVKIMRRDGREPPLADLFGYGFLRYAPAQSYTTAGSFSRFLLEKYGADRFRALYRSGGDFGATYGKSLADLGTEWSKKIDETPLSDEDRGLAIERLRIPSVFHKVCAHELAVRREEAHAATARGDHDRALALFDSIIADDPDEPAHLAELMDAESAAHRDDQARATADRLLAHPKVSDSQRARALIFIGDGELRRGEPGAADTFRKVLALPLDENTARLLRAKLIAATDPQIGRPLARYLVGDGPTRDAALDLLRAQEVVAAAPDRGLGHYLLGRQLAGHDRPAEARDEIAKSLALGLPDPGFTVEARRLAATSAFRAGDRESAKKILNELVNDPNPLVRGEARDMLARCDFHP
jgi:hypothetical protein